MYGLLGTPPTFVKQNWSVINVVSGHGGMLLSVNGQAITQLSGNAGEQVGVVPLHGWALPTLNITQVHIIISKRY